MPRAGPPPSPNQYRVAPAGFIAPMAGSIDQRFAAVADAINRKADRNATATFEWIRLVSPDGATWAVSVDNAGVLRTTKVLR